MSVDKKNKGQFQLYAEVNSIMGFHGRHSYKVFKNCKTENLDLGRTLLNNCSLQNCGFINCSMDSVDYQGTEFDHCAFFNVSFKGADISSCIFKSCSFDNCKFASTNFIDNNISLSTFNSTDFDCATVNNNIWTRCEFIHFTPDDTAIYSNEFIKCSFFKSQLLSAIYYTIFNNCKFSDSVIDSYILGFQFGLRSKDFKNLEIEHFGEKNVDYKRMQKMMHMVYKERNMPLENKILDLIFTNKLGVEVERLVNLIFNSLSSGLIVKVDEVRFIRKIINNLYRENKISLFYYLLIIERLKEQPISVYRNILSENVFNEITMFYHLLYSIKMEIESGYIQLCDTINNNFPFLQNSQVELIYSEKPFFRIYEIINQITDKQYLPVQESYGSFHECYEITKEILENLSVILTIIGTSVSAIIIAIKKFVKKRKAEKEKSVTAEQENAEYKASKADKETVIENYTSTETYDIIEQKVREIQTEDQNTFIRETIFHQTVHTVVVHKEKVISCYDNKNLKKIVIK